jgi:hypothetical protein
MWARSRRWRQGHRQGSKGNSRVMPNYTNAEQLEHQIRGFDAPPFMAVSKHFSRHHIPKVDAKSGSATTILKKANSCGDKRLWCMPVLLRQRE